MYSVIGWGAGEGALREYKIMERKFQTEDSSSYVMCIYLPEGLWWTCYFKMEIIGKVSFIQVSLQNCEGHIETILGKFLPIVSFCVC